MDNAGIFCISSLIHVVTPHLNCLNKTVLTRDHNISFLLFFIKKYEKGPLIISFTSFTSEALTKEEKISIILYFFTNTCCDPSFELSQQDGSY